MTETKTRNKVKVGLTEKAQSSNQTPSSSKLPLLVLGLVGAGLFAMTSEEPKPEQTNTKPIEPELTPDHILEERHIAESCYLRGTDYKNRFLAVENGEVYLFWFTGGGLTRQKQHVLHIERATRPESIAGPSWEDIRTKLTVTTRSDGLLQIGTNSHTVYWSANSGDESGLGNRTVANLINSTIGNTVPIKTIERFLEFLISRKDEMFLDLRIIPEPREDWHKSYDEHQKNHHVLKEYAYTAYGPDAIYLLRRSGSSKKNFTVWKLNKPKDNRVDWTTYPEAFRKDFVGENGILNTTQPSEIPVEFWAQVYEQCQRLAKLPEV